MALTAAPPPGDTGLSGRWPEAGEAGVLMLHGFGADRLSWLATQPAIERFAPVVTLDLPGHGGSSVEVGDGRIETLARKVAETLDARATRALHVVAHSLGAGVALALAELRPDLVRSLALIAPAGLGQGVDREFLRAYPELSTLEEAMPMLQRLVVRERLISKMMASRALSQLQRPGARDALRSIASGFDAAGPALERAALSLAARGVPRLLIWGEQDRINPLSEPRASAFGGERLLVAEAGHLPHIENPALVNERLVQFLTEVGGGAA